MINNKVNKKCTVKYILITEAVASLKDCLILPIVTLLKLFKQFYFPSYREVKSMQIV